MISFFRKIRKDLFTEKTPSTVWGRFFKYLIYAFGEIILVVIGILIALQINNWNNDRMNRKQELKIYQTIKSQVIEDLNEISKVIDYNTHFTNQFEKGNQYILAKNRNAIDTLAYIAMNLSQFSDFHRSSNIYETLVNSGDIKLLKNDSITFNLQKLEMTYNMINRLEDIHWELIITEVSPVFRGVVNYTTFEIIKPDELYSVELQNLFFECINLMKIKDAVYQQALGEMNAIVGLIDEELEE
jgi:hypothetical protein